jgi:protein arginine N-methyltransferase 2
MPAATVASNPDSLAARITAECPDPTRQILLLSWSHDVSTLKSVLDRPGLASLQDTRTLESPLHAAIRSCGPADPDVHTEAEDIKVEEAKETLRELFFCGGIWNDVDDQNETPGCVALRLGRRELYDLCVQAGVRAEMLFGLMGSYEELSSGPDEEDEEEQDEQVNTGETASVTGKQKDTEAGQGVGAQGDVASTHKGEDDVNSDQYLQSTLTLTDSKLVDSDNNGVMMAWETDIMRCSVDALLQVPPTTSADAATHDAPFLATGKRVLNIGFGMGIIDTMFAKTRPSRHHIIEAHPTVLTSIATSSTFGPSWEEAAPSSGANKVYAGRWQDVVPVLLSDGEIYDAIYFDTFGEDYSQLKLFFTEYVPALLDQDGKFGFFNGLGADRQICYDVYTKVVEMHLSDASMDVDWVEIDVDMKGLGEAGKGEWEGVRRRYWTLDSKSPRFLITMTH